MAYKDLYVIGHSPQFAITGREKISENLALTASPTATSGILKGTVTSGGVPIANATIKVFDINDNPIEHTNTGDNGQYTISDIPVGSYKVTAISPRYLLPLTIPVSIQNNKTATANIVLTADPDANLSVIYGIIRNTNGEVPIANAGIALYSIADGVETIIATTRSNTPGRYLFANVTPGNYLVKSTKQEEVS